MTATLRVLSAGVLTSVQDAGRPAAVRYGVPRGGAMDPLALLAANRLLGNPPGAAALEITAGGASFAALRHTALAVTGADLGATLNGLPLPPWTAVAVRAGDTLALPGRTLPWGARAYLALLGGVDVPTVLGSRSTHLSGGFGGLEGRRLRAGDVLSAAGGRSTKGTKAPEDGMYAGAEPSAPSHPLTPSPSHLVTPSPPHLVTQEPLLIAGRAWPAELRPAYGPGPTLRFVPGPHLEHFAAGALEALVGAPLRVGAASNRMGYRLEGAQTPYARPVSLPSLGVIPGAIQVPPDGAPILLMADAQTTGGYPIIGVVIAPDLPLAAQLLPGDGMRLAPVTEDEALAAHRAYAAWCAAPLEDDPAAGMLGLAGAPG